MKSLISLLMILLLVMSMMHLAVAQYSGTMDTKLLYGVAKEVRSGVRYGMVTVGEGLHPSNTSASTTKKHALSKSNRKPSSKHKVPKKRRRAPRSHYARYVSH